jgi:hypothetical protein
MAWSDLLATAKDHLRALYALCLQHAQSTGTLPAGDDAGDL